MTPTSTEPGEGAIRFHYRLDPPHAADTLDADRFERLGAWRNILQQLHLLGRDAHRYDGYAYGNMSTRDLQTPARFYVTASQTSGAPRLVPQDIVRIDRWNAERFEVTAAGTLPPSSESITHGIIYAADPTIAWIMHVHAPDIWRRGAPAAPVHRGRCPLRFPAMAHAVAALLGDCERPLVFVTLGHEDGVFACGATPEDTGLRWYARLRMRSPVRRESRARPPAVVGAIGASNCSISPGCRSRRSIKRDPRLEPAFEAIHGLKVRGAPAIGIAAAYALVVAMQAPRGATGLIVMRSRGGGAVARRPAHCGEPRLGYRPAARRHDRMAMVPPVTRASRRKRKRSTPRTHAACGHRPSRPAPDPAGLRRAHPLQRRCARGLGTRHRDRAAIPRARRGCRV